MKEKRWSLSYDLKGEVTWMGNNRATTKALRQRRLAHFNSSQIWTGKQIPWESCYNPNFDSISLKWTWDFAFLTSSWVTVLVWRPHLNSKVLRNKSECAQGFMVKLATLSVRVDRKKEVSLGPSQVPLGRLRLPAGLQFILLLHGVVMDGECGGIFQKK